MKVEDLRRLVREAGGSAVAVAISSGGALALQAAARGVSLQGSYRMSRPLLEKMVLGHSTRKRGACMNSCRRATAQVPCGSS